MKSRHLFTNDTMIQITCADPSDFIDRIGRQGIMLYDIEYVDEITVNLQCDYAHIDQLLNFAKRMGAESRIVQQSWLRKAGFIFQKRLVIIIFMIFILTLVLLLPTKVLFIRVQGNDKIPAARIVEEARQCGVYFGASCRRIHNESAKNALIGAIPELKWVGIDISGCVVTIHVREKTATDQVAGEVGAGSIVAARDGIIDSCTVESGTVLCKVGDAVKAGQILVSGYTDCGIMLKNVRAKAEVSAKTHRKLQAIAPEIALKRYEPTNSETKISLRLGKKLINFFKDSGISDTSCVKMYSEYCLTLPGGFQLPIALVIQRSTCYSVSPQTAVEAEQLLPNYCRDYLRKIMIAGSILHEDSHVIEQNGVYTFHGEYVCLEMIGQFVHEEIVEHD